MKGQRRRGPTEALEHYALDQRWEVGLVACPG